MLRQLTSMSLPQIFELLLNHDLLSHGLPLFKAWQTSWQQLHLIPFCKLCCFKSWLKTSFNICATGQHGWQLYQPPYSSAHKCPCFTDSWAHVDKENKWHQLLPLSWPPAEEKDSGKMKTVLWKLNVSTKMQKHSILASKTWMMCPTAFHIIMSCVVHHTESQNGWG